MVYVYGKDHPKNKEPIGLLIALFVFGGVAAYAVLYLGDGAEFLFNKYIHISGELGDFLFYLLAVALVEEGVKYIVLLIITWRAKSFDCWFDGVIYAVFVSLGFATLENVYYLFADDNPFGLAMRRALVSVPGHAINGVFMGTLYSLARLAANSGKKGAKKGFLLLSLLVPTITHGFYDYVCSRSSNTVQWIWIVYVVISTIVAICLIRSFSRNDKYIRNVNSK